MSRTRASTATGGSFSRPKANGAAIYGTRVLTPYRVSGWAFTRGKDGQSYAIRLWKEGERHVVRPVVPKAFDGSAVRRVVHLATGAEIPFDRTDSGLLLRLPDGLDADAYADAFRLESRPVAK